LPDPPLQPTNSVAIGLILVTGPPPNMALEAISPSMPTGRSGAVLCLLRADAGRLVSIRKKTLSGNNRGP
jgi:hypothetical protein